MTSSVRSCYAFLVTDKERQDLIAQCAGAEITVNELAEKIWVAASPRPQIRRVIVFSMEKLLAMLGSSARTLEGRNDG